MKYIVSVGHTAKGNIGSGASKYLDESDCTRQIVPLVVSKLQSLGNTAIKLQIDNSDSKDYVKRTNQANSIGGDMFVEIHLNSGGGSGCEVLTTNGSKATTQAVKISQCISKTLGITNRGHKTTNGLYVLNRTNMPSLLVECCFVDSQIDSRVYNAEKIANAIVEGLTGQVIQSTKYTIGWNSNSKGYWYSSDGNNYYKDCWKRINNKWYSFNSNGYARRSVWLQDKGYWYWLKDDCVMACNEWIEVKNKWYRFNTEGAMLFSKWYQNDKNEWFYLDKDGVMVTGWQTIDNKQYYFNKDGVMQTLCIIDGKMLGTDGTIL